MRIDMPLIKPEYYLRIVDKYYSQEISMKMETKYIEAN